MKLSELNENISKEIWDVDYMSTSDEEDNDSEQEDESESEEEKEEAKVTEDEQ